MSRMQPMTLESRTEILRAWLKQEHLQLCTLTSDPAPLDGMHEAQALREIAGLCANPLADTAASDDFSEEEVTKEFEPVLLANHIEACRVAV